MLQKSTPIIHHILTWERLDVYFCYTKIYKVLWLSYRLDPSNQPEPGDLSKITNYACYKAKLLHRYRHLLARGGTWTSKDKFTIMALTRSLLWTCMWMPYKLEHHRLKFVSLSHSYKLFIPFHSTVSIWCPYPTNIKMQHIHETLLPIQIDSAKTSRVMLHTGSDTSRPSWLNFRIWWKQ